MLGNELGNQLATVILVVSGGYGIYLLGHSLIEAYFRRKEKFVDKLQDKLRGNSDGAIE